MINDMKRWPCQRQIVNRYSLSIQRKKGWSMGFTQVKNGRRQPRHPTRPGTQRLRRNRIAASTSGATPHSGIAHDTKQGLLLGGCQAVA